MTARSRRRPSTEAKECPICCEDKHVFFECPVKCDGCDDPPCIECVLATGDGEGFVKCPHCSVVIGPADAFIGGNFPIDAVKIKVLESMASRKLEAAVTKFVLEAISRLKQYNLRLSVNNRLPLYDGFLKDLIEAYQVFPDEVFTCANLLAHIQYRGYKYIQKTEPIDTVAQRLKTVHGSVVTGIFPDSYVYSTNPVATYRLSTDRTTLLHRLGSFIGALAIAAGVDINFGTETATSTEKKIEYRQCPLPNCAGVIRRDVCIVCNSQICDVCNCAYEGAEKHKCNPDDVASYALILSTSKPCPGCKTFIHKIEGCYQMWCTKCHTTFDWSTLRILGGPNLVIHNPHAIEYARAQRARAQTAASRLDTTGYIFNSNLCWSRDSPDPRLTNTIPIEGTSDEVESHRWDRLHFYGELHIDPDIIDRSDRESSEDITMSLAVYSYFYGSGVAKSNTASRLVDSQIWQAAVSMWNNVTVPRIDKIMRKWIPGLFYASLHMGLTTRVSHQFCAEEILRNPEAKAIGDEIMVHIRAASEAGNRFDEVSHILKICECGNAFLKELNETMIAGFELLLKAGLGRFVLYIIGSFRGFISMSFDSPASSTPSAFLSCGIITGYDGKEIRHNSALGYWYYRRVGKNASSLPPELFGGPSSGNNGTDKPDDVDNLIKHHEKIRQLSSSECYKIQVREPSNGSVFCTLCDSVISISSMEQHTKTVKHKKKLHDLGVDRADHWNVFVNNNKNGDPIPWNYEKSLEMLELAGITSDTIETMPEFIDRSGPFKLDTNNCVLVQLIF